MKAGTIGQLAILLTLGLLLGGCRGKKLGTAELHGPGLAETMIQASGKKKLALWADLDGKWTGSDNSNMEIVYEVDVLQNGKPLGHLSCSTADSSTRVCGTVMTVNDSHDADCELALPCKVPPVAAGDVIFKVKATLGSNAKSVRKMSLNVRED